MNYKASFRLVSYVFGIIVMGAITASAQDDKGPLDDVFACVDIETDQERWRCYDEQVPLLREREQKKEIVTIDSEKVEEIERDAFGFSLPKLNILRPKDKNEANDKGKSSKIKKTSQEQIFQVASLRKGRSGLRVTMENGQVWQQVTGNSSSLPKGKIQARIKPASFGSYLMSILNEDGKAIRRGIRVRRVK